MKYWSKKIQVKNKKTSLRVFEILYYQYIIIKKKPHVQRHKIQSIYDIHVVDMKMYRVPIEV